MNEINEQSLEMHAKFGGKLEVRSKVPVATPEDLLLAYTPGVGHVSEVVAKDNSLAYKYTIKKNTVAVITDGSAVLGLGNLGPFGALPVMEGKCILGKEFANLDSFPICLDTQDTEKIIETIKNIAPGFGAIHLEDISAPRCFEIEERLQAVLSIPVLHDDQHGTAVVVLAGLINALKLKNLEAAYAKVVVNGAGAAGIAIAKLLSVHGFKNITVCDSMGIIASQRTDLNIYKKNLLEITNLESLTGGLSEAVAGTDIFIGVSVKDVFNEAMIKTMNAQPIIFAMSNPNPEIDPHLALKAGAFIVGTGRSDFPNQINNVLAFPGIFRGALDNRINKITPQMLIQAAKNLAACVKNPSAEEILPNLFDKNVHLAVALAIKN